MFSASSTTWIEIKPGLNASYLSTFLLLTVGTLPKHKVQCCKCRNVPERWRQEIFRILTAPELCIGWTRPISSAQHDLEQNPSELLSDPQHSCSWTAFFQYLNYNAGMLESSAMLKRWSRINLELNSSRYTNYNIKMISYHSLSAKHDQWAQLPALLGSKSIESTFSTILLLVDTNSLKPKLQSCKSRNFEALGSAEGLEQEKLNLKSSHYRTIQQINVLGLKLYLD